MFMCCPGPRRYVFYIFSHSTTAHLNLLEKTYLQIKPLNHNIEHLQYKATYYNNMLQLQIKIYTDKQMKH